MMMSKMCKRNKEFDMRGEGMKKSERGENHPLYIRNPSPLTNKP
jgi:hypothetical protein